MAFRDGERLWPATAHNDTRRAIENVKHGYDGVCDQRASGALEWHPSDRLILDVRITAVQAACPVPTRFLDGWRHGSVRAVGGARERIIVRLCAKKAGLVVDARQSRRTETQPKPRCGQVGFDQAATALRVLHKGYFFCPWGSFSSLCRSRQSPSEYPKSERVEEVMAYYPFSAFGSAFTSDSPPSQAPTQGWPTQQTGQLQQPQPSHQQAYQAQPQQTFYLLSPTTASAAGLSQYAPAAPKAKAVPVAVEGRDVKTRRFGVCKFFNPTKGFGFSRCSTRRHVGPS